MFVQVITGKAKDPEGLHRQMQRWNDELRPGATGFLGATGGVTPDGRFVAMARFASEADARTNSDRPEQGAWWSETEPMLEDPQFADSAEVKTMGGGPSEDAGFVQVMRGRVKDRAALATLEQQMDEFEDAFRAFRPDVVGSVSALHPDGTYTDAIYFTSEAEARAGERKETPAEVAEVMSSMEDAVVVDEFLDLPDPWHH